ncbi:MAG: Ser-Thr-rich GPI-anchored membrane family protein, partial [bacterium]
MLRIRQGLMFLACVASAIPWSFAGGSGQVLVPSGGERWSVGSNVQLEWELSGADSVNLYLVDSDHDNKVVGTIAKGIENRSHFQWFISELPEGVDFANRHKICVTADSCDGASVALSDVINLQQHAQPETFRGNRQSYTLDDRAWVYIPAAGEIVTRDEENKVTLRWDDVDHWLLDLIAVEVRQHGRNYRLSRVAMMNTGFKKIEIDPKYCDDTEKPCYFRINSTLHPDRVITSGHFIVGDTSGLASPNCGENLDQDTKYFAIGEQLDVGWTIGENDLGQDLRVELYKDGSYYLTIAERQLTSAGNRLVEPWTISFVVREGDDYTIRVSSRDHGKVLGFSNVFSIEGAREEPVTMAITSPLAGVLWERKENDGPARFKIEWEDSADADAPSRSDHVKIALYKNERRFKSIFNQSTGDDGEKIQTARKHIDEETHTWVMPQTVPSGSDYAVRVMSYGDESGYESDYDDSGPFEISNDEDDETDAFDAGGSDDADCPVSVQLLCLEDSADCPVDEEQEEAYALNE